MKVFLMYEDELIRELGTYPPTEIKSLLELIAASGIVYLDRDMVVSSSYYNADMEKFIIEISEAAN